MGIILVIKNTRKGEMSQKSTDAEREKFKHVEVGSQGSLDGVSKQRYDLNLLCWRMAAQHKDCSCWACVYVEGQRS